MKKRPMCALRTLRRSWGLSQRDLADLLGFDGPTYVSRLEHGKRTPRLETALTCSTLFGVPPGDLFPQVACETGHALQERIARHLKDRPQPSTGSVSRKRELLGRVLRKDGDVRNTKEVCSA
jgi:transcriptional regulator with XRE-family HTH domain